LRAAHDHAPSDSADRQRERHLLPRRRAEREDHRAHLPGRWRAAGGVFAVGGFNSQLPTPNSQLIPNAQLPKLPKLPNSQNPKLLRGFELILSFKSWAFWKFWRLGVG